MKDSKEISFSTAISFASQLLKSLASSTYIFAIILSLWLFVTGSKSKADWSVCVTTLLIFVLLDLVLFIKGRAFLNRVDCIAYLAINIVLVTRC